MFDRVVCLNIDKRIEEQKRIQLLVQEVLGKDVEFFLAGRGQKLPYDYVDVVSPPPREGYPAWTKRPNSWNAFRCFKHILLKSKEMGTQNTLLLEDDVDFIEGAKEVLQESLEELPNDWDLFYLGANHTWAITYEISKHILRLKGSGCFHAVCIRNTVYDDILALPMENPIDGVVAKYLHPDKNCYGIWPNIAITVPGYSYCEGTEVNYNHFFSHKGN
jgi:hypothetical protein